MGNATSSNKHKLRRKPQEAAWAWNFSDGRAFIKPAGAAKPKPRPLFKKQPSNNYDWWIFNPDAKRSSARRSSSGGRRRSGGR